MSDLYQRAREIGEEALRVPESERDAFLAKACGDNPELRKSVETWIAGQGLDMSATRSVEPPSGTGSRGGTDVRDAVTIDTDDVPPDSELTGDETLPTNLAPKKPDQTATFGKYSLIRKIGEGGMGSVYEAEQDNPRRRVALKVIRSGVASRELLQRFEHEAQVLGSLSHVGIAQIYEAGTADTGHGDQPYFAMEYIEGEPLDEYAANHDLSTENRLELLAKICEAVDHAHQNGVIHRDIKPGNILVDNTGQPKILDFGVARATNADIKKTTLHTDIGQLLGTVPYMSPEQASGNPEELDHRSDVYALGVLGYELLTGRLPYDLQDKLIHEAVRVIQEEKPVRLSTINRVLRGDIEIMVNMALRKEKERRYQSAEELASDIRRYQRSEPIIARKPTIAYRVTKFAQRRKVAIGVVTILVLAAGIVYFVSQGARGQRIAELIADAKLVDHSDPKEAMKLLDEVLEMDPNHQIAIMRRAEILFKLNSYGDVVAICYDCIRRFPSNPHPHELLSRVFENPLPKETLGDLDVSDFLPELDSDDHRVREEYHHNKAIELRTEDDLYLEAIAKSAIQGREAIDLLTQVIQDDRLKYFAWYRRAWRHHSLGLYEDMANDAAYLTNVWPDSSQYWNTRAHAHNRRGEYVDADDAFNKAIAIMKQQGKASALGLISRARNKLAIAVNSQFDDERRALLESVIRDCSDSIRDMPEVAEGYAVRAEARARLEQWLGVYSDFEETIRREPSNVMIRSSSIIVGEKILFEEPVGQPFESWRNTTFYSLARGLALQVSPQEDFRGAIDALSKAIEIGGPGLVLARFQRANTSRYLLERTPTDNVTRRRVLDAMIEDLDWTIEQAPRFRQAFELRSWAHSKTGNEKEAIEDFLEVAELGTGTQIANPAKRIAELYLETGQFAKGLEYLELGMSLRPGRIQYEDLANRARCLRRLGKFEDALTDYDASIEDETERSERLRARQYSGRGITYLFADRLEDALADFAKAREVSAYWSAIQTGIWSYLILDAQGDAEAKAKMLEELDRILEDAGDRKILAMFLGNAELDEVMEGRPAEERGYLSFYRGARALVADDYPEARRWLQACVDSKCFEMPEYDLALWYLKRIPAS